MTVKVRKRNGRRQKYKKSKVISSLQKAGIETRIAHSIENSLVVRNGISSKDIKSQIHGILEKVDRVAANRYWSTKGLDVNVETLGVDGSAVISCETLTDLGIHAGGTLDIFNGEKYETVRAYPLDGNMIRPGIIQISKRDMVDLGVHSGSRIAVRKHIGLT